MLLVYTHKITPRLTYIFKHIFVRILNIPVSFTTKIEEFVAHSGLKMTYGKAPLGNEFYIRGHELLFEQGINDVDISVHMWDDEVPCFFNAGKKSSIKYDVFAASFYLLSRYEEYLPHVQDELERFPAEESLAFQNNFIEKPVIDIWAFKLLDALKEKYPDYSFTTRKYKYLSTFSIKEAYAYKSKGLVRSIGGFLNDFFRLKLGAVWLRFLVLVNFKKDPFDTYDQIIKLKRKFKVNTILFFLIANYTTFDRNISITKTRYKLLIKSIADYVKVGLSASYFTMNNEELLKKETKKLESIINTPVLLSRQYLMRMEFPETYQSLIDLEVGEDYSMGYADAIGYRAGTCTPFYFYDLDYEIQTPLKVVPFVVSDTVLNEVLHLSPKAALLKIKTLVDGVKQVNGMFTTLFHNEVLSNYGNWKGWQNFYAEVLKVAKDD